MRVIGSNPDTGFEWPEGDHLTAAQANTIAEALSTRFPRDTYCIVRDDHDD